MNLQESYNQARGAVAALGIIPTIAIGIVAVLLFGYAFDSCSTYRANQKVDAAIAAERAEADRLRKERDQFEQTAQKERQDANEHKQREQQLEIERAALEGKLQEIQKRGQQIESDLEKIRRRSIRLGGNLDDDINRVLSNLDKLDYNVAPN